LSEPLRARLRDLNLERASLYLPRTKNDEARTVYLPAVLVTAFANQPPRIVRGAGIKTPGRGQIGPRQTDARGPFLERAPPPRPEAGARGRPRGRGAARAGPRAGRAPPPARPARRRPAGARAPGARPGARGGAGRLSPLAPPWPPSVPPPPPPPPRAGVDTPL